MRRFILYTLCLQIVISSFFIGASDTYVWGPLCIGYIVLFLLYLFDKLKKGRKSPLPKMLLFFLVLFLISLTIQNFFPTNVVSIPGTFEVDVPPKNIELSSSFLHFKLSFYQWLMPIIALVIIPYALKSRTEIKILLMCMTFIPCAQGVLGIFQYSAAPDSILKGFNAVQGGLTGTYVTRNVYACLLAVGFPLLLGQIVYSFSRQPPIRYSKSIGNIVDYYLLRNAHFPYILFLSFSGVCMFISVMLSFSRTGIVCSILAILSFLVVFAFFQKRRHRHYTWAILLATLFIITITSILFVYNNSYLRSRFSTDDSSTPTYRLEHFTMAANMIKESPWFGNGGGQFRYHFELYRELPIKVEYRHLKNDYIEFCIEYGLVPALIGVVILILCAKIIFSNKASSSRFHPALWTSCLVSFVAMMIFATLHFSFHVNGHRLFAAYLMGVLLSMKLESKSMKARGRSSKNRE